MILVVLVLIASTFSLPIPNGTNYHYYCVGNCDVGASVTTSPGVVLMGGGPDVDMAFQWMISKCEGGDFLVIRTDDDSEYNQYIYDLGRLNSAATLVLFNRDASFEPQVEKILADADCLFMAGGDQWTYYSFWKDSPVSATLNDLMNVKGIPIGGTSAGMESSGEFVNTAQFSSSSDLTSQEALADPYYELVTIGDDFLNLIFMENILTDAHFEQRDRMGRLVTFVARLYTDVWTAMPHGIACNEGTALLVDSNGHVSIRAWESDGCAYFLTPTQNATVCTPGSPLTFDNVDVFRACGNETYVFDLSTWDGIQGVPYQVSANSGDLTSTQKGGSIY